jgi:hypothetical protein
MASWRTDDSLLRTVLVTGGQTIKDKSLGTSLCSHDNRKRRISSLCSVLVPAGGQTMKDKSLGTSHYCSLYYKDKDSISL